MTMGAVYSDDGTYLGGSWPTWDAHHYYIERRATIPDARWAQFLADPDWTDHAREDLRAERVCDRCLISVARGHGTSGPQGSPERRKVEQRAQQELHARRADPGYEYATTRGPRKAWYDYDVPPEGDGWERNVDAGDGGWERFDTYEVSYWRRRKGDDE